MAVALLPLSLAFLMLVVGLRLTGEDFLTLWREPRAVLTGFAAQMLGLPLLALIIAKGLDLSPQMTLGLLVVAAAPGGITSNFMAVLARADVALSATMTLGTSLLAAVSVPLVLLAGQAEVAGGLPTLVLAVGRTGLAVLAVSAVPLIAGMAIRRFAPDAAGRWAGLLDRLSTAVFFAIVLATFVQNGPELVAYAAVAGPAALLLNVGAIALAFLMGHAARLRRRQTMAIAIECGLQNIAMAIFLASSVLHEPALVIPALVYAVVMNISALGLIAFARRDVAPDLC